MPLNLLFMMELIHKIPIVTTVFSAYFFIILYNHWNVEGRPSYLLWWTLGVLFYGLGTLTESLVGLFDWSEPVFKAWYILGALLGGVSIGAGFCLSDVQQKNGRYHGRGCGDCYHHYFNIDSPITYSLRAGRAYPADGACIGVE